MTTKPRSEKLTEAISALIVQQPFFAVLLMDLLEIEETETLPTAGTDGKKLYVNPKFFEKLSVQERIGVLAHEVMHVILLHPARMKSYLDRGFGPDLKPWNTTKYNHAADYVINSYLIDLKFQLPLGSLINPQITSADIVDEVYLKIPDPPEDDKNSGWDQHMPQAGDDPLDKATVQRAVKQAQAVAEADAKRKGKTLSEGIGRLIDSICETQVQWQDHLRKVITASVGTDSSTWNKANRRKLAVAPHVYWPGRQGSRSGQIAVEIDTSGSIGDRELKVFLGELHGILSDIQPEKIHVLYVDDKVQGDVHEIDDPNDLLDLGARARGGGGTDMTVVFREIQDRELPVDTAIIFTDGYTDFGPEQGIQTIWCMTTDKVAPWGTTVRVKV